MADKWWFNSRTGEVEQGMLSNSVDRVGPFDSREEAQRAPERLRENSARWAAEEAEEERDR